MTTPQSLRDSSTTRLPAQTALIQRPLDARALTRGAHKIDNQSSRQIQICITNKNWRSQDQDPAVFIYFTLIPIVTISNGLYSIESTSSTTSSRKLRSLTFPSSLILPRLPFCSERRITIIVPSSLIFIVCI